MGLLSQTLNQFGGHRQLMGPNTFNLFCTLEIGFALLAVFILFQAAPLLATGSYYDHWHFVFAVAMVVHAALLMYNGIRREFSPSLVRPAIYIAYGAYLTWPFAATPLSNVQPWCWLFGLYGLLTPLFLAKAKKIIIHIVIFTLLLALSEFAAASLNNLEIHAITVIAEATFFASIAVLFCGLVGLAIDTADHSDKIYNETLAAQLRFNRSRDHAKELKEFYKLVHDNVMAALLDASRFQGEIGDRTKALAERAIRVLEEETYRTMPHRPITFQALTEQIAAGVFPWNARLRFITEDDERYPKADPGSTMPQEVARAFTHAVTEAVSNSARHSDSRITHISIRTEMRRPANANRSAAEKPFILCTISDKGQGFNLKGLDLSRMGVRVSMLRSMQEVGGKVSIQSAPEKGTTVVVQWPDEEDDV